jgi:hypothetical protein
MARMIITGSCKVFQPECDDSTSSVPSCTSASSGSARFYPQSSWPRCRILPAQIISSRDLLFAPSTPSRLFNSSSMQAMMRAEAPGSVIDSSSSAKTCFIFWFYTTENLRIAVSKAPCRECDLALAEVNSSHG